MPLLSRNRYISLIQYVRYMKGTAYSLRHTDNVRMHKEYCVQGLLASKDVPDNVWNLGADSIVIMYCMLT